VPVQRRLKLRSREERPARQAMRYRKKVEVYVHLARARRIDRCDVEGASARAFPLSSEPRAGRGALARWRLRRHDGLGGREGTDPENASRWQQNQGAGNLNGTARASGLGPSPSHMPAARGPAPTSRLRVAGRAPGHSMEADPILRLRFPKLDQGALV
jgi:hypothetical protein